jgi:hypothetical protein
MVKAPLVTGYQPLTTTLGNWFWNRRQGARRAMAAAQDEGGLPR